MNKKIRKRQSRSLSTKKRLLAIGIATFASKGYEGVGTRELADRAKVNLRAIRYHFGDKKGLYRAVIRHVSDGINERMEPFIEQVTGRIQKRYTSREELITSLCGFITSFSSHLLASDLSDNWARLVIREQLSPTDAFPFIYRVLRLFFDAIAQIIAKFSGGDPDSVEVRISAMAIIGQVTIFKTHRASHDGTVCRLFWREAQETSYSLRIHCCRIVTTAFGFRRRKSRQCRSRASQGT